MKPPHADPLHQRVQPSAKRLSTVLLGTIGLALVLGAVADSAAGRVTTFARAELYKAGGGHSIAAGDLDRNGSADIVTANYGGGGVNVLLNRGRGRFHPPVTYGTGFSTAVAVGDLNRDGAADIATANFGNTVSVFLNHGNGTFPTERHYRGGGSPRTKAIALRDVNGDGSRDLVTTDYRASSVFVLLNRGDGSFKPKLAYEVARRPYSVALGDLNGDGRTDIATANCGSSTVSVLLNRATASFAPRHDYRGRGCLYSVSIGDLNSDGRSDLVVASRCNLVFVLLNRGRGTFGRARAYPAGGDCQDSLVLGDLNGDGNLDVATPNGASSDVSVLVNNGDGTLQPPLEYRTAYASTIASADFNADRRLDLASTALIGGVSILINAPGVCDVQDVWGLPLVAATRTLARVNCRVGNTARAYSSVKAGRVISQKPKFGAVRPGGAEVSLVVSLGRKA